MYISDKTLGLIGTESNTIATFVKTPSKKPINLDPLQYSYKTDTASFCSEIMNELKKNIAELATKDNNILIVGEQGSGKHYTAKIIHSKSTYSNGPFKNLFCSSLEETIQNKINKPGGMTGISTDTDIFGMDIQSGGTLFLNSFFELSPPIRPLVVKLLYDAQKAIEPFKKFRIIISVEKSADSDFEFNLSSDSLFSRLKPSVIQIPPLRMRCEDITLLIDQFLIDYALKNNVPAHAISPRAIYKCISYYWPGNIRQLKNTIEHAATLVSPGTMITSDKLPFSIDWKSPFSTMNSNSENSKSFLRAEKLLLKELVAKSELSERKLEELEFEFSIPFKNRKIHLS